MAYMGDAFNQSAPDSRMTVADPFQTVWKGRRYRYDQASNKVQQWEDSEGGWLDDPDAPIGYSDDGWLEVVRPPTIAAPQGPPLRKDPVTGIVRNIDDAEYAQLSWQAGDAGDRSWRYFDGTLKNFYQENKQAAYGQYLDDTIGVNSTPLRAYLNQNFDRTVREYYRANEADPRLMFVDALDNNFIARLRQSFQMQAPSNKGYNLQYMPQGRFTG